MNFSFRYIILIFACLVTYLPHQTYANVQKNAKRIYPVLLVEFEDVKFTVPEPKLAFRNMLNRKGYSTNGAAGSAADWLNANFKDTCTFEFIVSDVISLPYPVAKFGAHSNTFNDSDVEKMVRQACAALPGDFNIQECDTDENGIIGNISIIYAGYSEAEGGSEDAIWAHQKNLTANPITAGDMKILSYTCTPELKGAQGDTISPPGIFCHEFCHYLGLPDMYDTNGDTEGLSPALYGTLSIMDRGHFSNNGNTPPYLTSIEKEILGLGKVEELLPDSTYTIPPVQDSKVIYRINTSAEGEYFLVEYRDGRGWDKHIGGKGMVVYHIDKSSSTYAGLTSLQRWEYNNINTYSLHECARVLPAAGEGSNIAGVFFPGSGNIKELMSDRGNTPLLDWNGYAVGIGIKDINLSGGKLSFRTVRDYSFNDTLPQAVDSRVMPYQKDARIEWRGIESKKERNGNRIQWLITWGEEGMEERQSMVSDTSCCMLGTLLPGKEYTVEVRAFNNKEFGEATVLNFKTHPETSPYPYIFIAKEKFRLGKEADLRVFNLPSNAVYTNWYINGKRIENDCFVPTESGEMEIMVGIGYKDGTYEKIVKHINIR